MLKIKRKIFPDQEYKNLIKWGKRDGDLTHRLDYNLTDESVVFDLGGYKGQWTSDIFSRYLCTVFIFEPYEEYYHFIESRFRLNNKIHVFNCGLHTQDEVMNLNISEDSSSLYRKTDRTIPVKMRSITDFLAEYKIMDIDLMKINIEGAEYDLLELMIQKRITEHINNLQIQFHSFIPHAASRMEVIQENLAKTHSLTYQYRFVWENWKLLK